MLWRLRNNQPMTTIRIVFCAAGTPSLGSRPGAVADLRLQLVEFLTEMPGTPLLLMAHSVQPSRISVLAHGTLATNGVST